MHSKEWRLAGGVLARAGLGAVLALALAAPLALAQRTDPGLERYRPVEGVSGKLSSRGSDTLNNLMTFWTEEFRRHYPAVAVEVQGAGSSTAPPALTEGSSNMGPMSRRMKDKEIEAFERRHGYKPTAVPVAIDALAVFVHKDNPVDSLSIPELDAIFSATRSCGYGKKVERWGDLRSQQGISRRWRRRKLALYGRNSVSGTYGYFKKVALCKGDYKSRVNEQSGSASVVQSVGKSLGGIGYSGVGYLTSEVKVLSLSKRDGGRPVAPTPENALQGTYPLSRFLWVYVNKPPGRSLPPVEREFLRMVLSRQGQEIVAKDGYVPLSAELAREARSLLR